MKKIFCIISAVIIGMVGSFLSILAVCRKTTVRFEEPYSINVYNRSSTTANNGSYYIEDDVFHGIIKYLKKTLTSSLLTLMVNENNLTGHPTYGGDTYASYDTEMKQKNLVIEFIYKGNQDIVVYENGNSRIMSFASILFIIPCNSKFEEIVVYNSLTNSQDKDTEYKENVPFILRGNPRKLLKYVDKIA